MSLILAFMAVGVGWFFYHAVRDAKAQWRVDRFIEQRDGTWETPSQRREDEEAAGDVADGPVPKSSEEREREYERKRRERDFALHLIHKAEMARTSRRNREGN